MLDASSIRIAVIDDDPVFLELMEDLLGVGEGYAVATCSSWVRSFEFVKQVQPDLIILDLMLGRDQAGFAVLDLLRAEPATHRVPVILCSAAAPALTDHAHRLRTYEQVGCVSKPFDVGHLLQTISCMLAGSRAAAGAD